MAHSDRSELATSLPSSSTARNALIILTGINLFNYVDRLMVPTLFNSLKKEFGLTDTQQGLLLTGFLVVYMLTSPVFGRLGDRANRPRLMAIGVAIWSVATALGGFAGSLVGLLFARAAVGIGEAAYGTIAPALLADYFPKSRRGRIFAIFYAAIPVGGALGYVVGSLLDTHFGWRAAFFAAGAPGLLLALMMLRIPDAVRGAQDDPDESPEEERHQSAWSAYRGLFRNANYSATVWGYAAYTFALGALVAWMPAFLTRVRHLSEIDAGSKFGAVVVITGLIGTFAGGWVGDRVLHVHRHGYLLVSGIATLLAAPLTWLALTSADETTYFAALVLGEILIFASTGPINSAIINYVSPGQRATAMALSILMIHLFGDVPSPTIVGMISDASTLQRAVLIIPVAVLLSGAIWTWAALRHSQDIPAKA